MRYLEPVEPDCVPLKCATALLIALGLAVLVGCGGGAEHGGDILFPATPPADELQWPAPGRQRTYPVVQDQRVGQRQCQQPLWWLP